MVAGSGRQLRVLLADGQENSLDYVASIVLRLGHVVVAQATDLEIVPALSEHDPPDAALVIARESSERTLGLLRTTVREATSPAIVVLKCSVFAYIANGEISDDKLESAISIVLHRFAEYHDLQARSAVAH